MRGIKYTEVKTGLDFMFQTPKEQGRLFVHSLTQMYNEMIGIWKFLQHTLSTPPPHLLNSCLYTLSVSSSGQGISLGVPTGTAEK